MQGFKIFIKEPFKIEKEGDAEENMVRNITGLSRIVEHFVNQYPLQWGGWFNRRWADGIDA